MARFKMLGVAISVLSLMSSCQSSQCVCTEHFCLFSVDGGGCESQYAYCGGGEENAACFPAADLIEGPVTDAGACPLATNHLHLTHCD